MKFVQQFYYVSHSNFIPTDKQCISSCIQNGIFIEPENVNYLDGGGILQTDDSCRHGSCIPTRSRIGGANYFDRESRVMHVVR